MSDTSIRVGRPSLRLLRPGAAFRLARPSDTWFKPALSVVAASAVPHLALLAVGRLDLAMYTMAGALCALYGHALPYARRAVAVAGVVLGMAAGLAVSLAVASLTGSAPVLIAVGALLAAAQKALCDVTRTGPPGPVVLTFVSSAALFSPQRAEQIPGHLALTLGAGAFAWLVVLAPALVRREGPERRVVARALDAAAGCADNPGPGTRAAAGAAVHAAWQSLLAAGRPTPARRSLEGLAAHAEAAFTAPGPGAGPAVAERLRGWAALTRARGPVPVPPPPPGGLHDVDAERAALRGPAGRRAARRALLRGLGPGSPLLPVAARTLAGCALAGYLCAALGAGRPYWAIVTAASLSQASLALSWNRALQRTLGNLLGVLVFAAVLPLSRTGPAALVLCCLFFSFAAEALITRNYWLGSVAVTPMALLVLEFGGTHPAGELIGDRVLDTVLGALAGFLAAVLVTNHRAARRVERAIDAAHRARADAERTGADPAAAPADRHRARRTLTASLVELREAGDVAAGEWRAPRAGRRAAGDGREGGSGRGVRRGRAARTAPPSRDDPRTGPERRLLAAERAGHRTLAATARRREGTLAPAPENGAE